MADLIRNTKERQLLSIARHIGIHVMSLEDFSFVSERFLKKCIDYIEKICGSFQGDFEIFLKKCGILDKF